MRPTRDLVEILAKADLQLLELHMGLPPDRRKVGATETMRVLEGVVDVLEQAFLEYANDRDSHFEVGMALRAAYVGLLRPAAELWASGEEFEKIHGRVVEGLKKLAGVVPLDS